MNYNTFFGILHTAVLNSVGKEGNYQFWETPSEEDILNGTCHVAVNNQHMFRIVCVTAYSEQYYVYYDNT